MPKQTFNSEPYFDDFDRTKGFHRVLYTPRGSVQTRELNQSQSILSNQISEFGDHIFKHGSMVSESVVKYSGMVDYVRLFDNDATLSPEPVDISKLTNRKIYSETSQITARITSQVAKTDLDPNTIYVQYITSGKDAEGNPVKRFLPGETLHILDDSDNIVYAVRVECPDCPETTVQANVPPIGYGSIFSVTEGVYYVFGYFVYTQTQDIIISKYHETPPSYNVGFDIVQSIVTANDDVSLLDNALGYPNHTAPGADRYKIELLLSKKTLGAEESDNFILLAKIESGVLNEIKDKPQYSEVMKMLARRTHDESGNYTVNPFLISFKNFLKSTSESNDGLEYPTGLETEAELEEKKNKFVAFLTPGKAYVEGYEIEQIANFFVEVDKARDSIVNDSSAIRTFQGSHIFATLAEDGSNNVISNVVPLNNTQEVKTTSLDFEQVELHDNVINNGVPTGSIIGYARIKGQEIYPTALADTVYKFYIFDLEFLDSANTFSDVVALHKPGITPFSAHTVNDEDIFSGTGIAYPKVYSPAGNNLLYQLPRNFVNDLDDITIVTRKKFTGSSDAAGKFTFTVTGNETIQTFNDNTWICGQQALPNGVFLPYELTSANTTAVSAQSVEITGFSANKNVVVICDVAINNITPREKILTEIPISHGITVGNEGTWIDLGITDALEIVSVTDDDNENADITADFELDRNIHDDYYSISKVRRLQTLEPLGDTLNVTITVKYFNHTGSVNSFFCVKSYDTIVNDPELDFDWEDIPVYVDSNGIAYQLASSLDFRPDMTDPGNSGDEFEDVTYVPSKDTNITFDFSYYVSRKDAIAISKDGIFNVIKGVPSTEPVVPVVPDGMMKIYELTLEPYTFDVKKDVKATYVDNRRFTMRDIGNIEKRVDNLEYYSLLNQLEKNTADLAIKDANGLDAFKNGFITDNFVDFKACDVMHPEFDIAIDPDYAELRPTYYPKVIYLELDEANSSNYQINGDMITQEYDDMLLVSHQEASKHISVNPYFIFNWEGSVELDPPMDNFKDVTTLPDLVVTLGNNNNASASTGTTSSVGGATFGSNSIVTANGAGGITGNASSNFLSQVQAQVTNQTISTGTATTIPISSGPFGGTVFTGGSVSPTLSGNFINSFQSIFGSWKSFNGSVTANSTITSGKSSVTTQSAARQNSVVTNVSVPSSFTTNATTNAGSKIIPTKTGGATTYDLGTRVTDVNLIAYIRALDVKFVVSGLRPETRVYPFFDGVDVRSYCRPLNGANGDALVTSAKGELVGVFSIPNNNTVRFHVGDRLFLLTDSDINADDPDMVTTSASTTFWAGGLHVETQDTYLKQPAPPPPPPPPPRPPKPSTCGDVCPVSAGSGFSKPCTITAQDHVARVNNKIATKIQRPDLKIVLTTDVAANLCLIERQRVDLRQLGEKPEPLAEQFWIDNPNGAFITKIGVYFKAKSAYKPVWLELREMINGYPGPRVFEYGRVVKQAANVVVSDDASVETIFEFSSPIYLKGDGQDYCFVVGSDDLDYRVFASKLGGNDIQTGKLITEHSYLGSMFRSQNNETWTASQFEDLKFNVYSAEFNRDTDMVLKFKNAGFAQEKLQNNPIETEDGSNKVRIFHKNHGLIASDKVNFNIYDDIEFDVYIMTGNLIKGQTFTGTSGAEATVKEFRFVDAVSVGVNVYRHYAVKFKFFSGKFSANEEFASDAVIENIGNSRLMRTLDIETKQFALPNSKYIDEDDVRSTYIPPGTIVDVPVQFTPELLQCTGVWMNDFIDTTFHGIDVDRFLEKDHLVYAVDSMDSYIIELTGENSVADRDGYTGGNGVAAKGNIQMDSFELEGTTFNHDSTFNWTADGIIHSGVGSVFDGQDYDSATTVPFESNTTIMLSQPLKIANAENESRISAGGGKKSLELTTRASSVSGDPFVSPVLIVPSLAFTSITNRIEFNDCATYSIAPNATTDGAALICDPEDPDYNARWARETSYNGGVEGAKYITKKVSLANPASSLRVFMDVYKNINNVIDVYYKTLTTEKTTGIESEPWVFAEIDQDVVSERDDEFREISITIGDEGLAQTPLPEFKEFRFKIVLKSKNSARPPRVKNFRAVAVL